MAKNMDTQTTSKMSQYKKRRAKKGKSDDVSQSGYSMVQAYDAVGDISIKSEDVKNIPLQKVTQRVDKKEELEDDYTGDDPYASVRRPGGPSSMPIAIDADSRYKRKLGLPKGRYKEVTRTDSPRSGVSAQPRRMLRRACFFATCYIVIGIALIFGLVMTICGIYLNGELDRLETQLNGLMCKENTDTISSLINISSSASQFTTWTSAKSGPG